MEDEEPKKRFCPCCKKVADQLERWANEPRIIRWVGILLLAGGSWCALQAAIGSEFSPGSQLFSFLSLFILAYVAGALTQLVWLPPLLGMLLAGVLLRNVGFIKLRGVYLDVANNLREMALCVILIRGGLGMDPKYLISLRGAILKLGIIPGTVEILISLLASHFLLDLPWMWALLYGVILVSISPAVVIPGLFILQEKGYGIDKGVPTLIVAVASLDNVLSFTLFGVVINVFYSVGSSIIMQVLQGPLEVLMGIVFGLLWGVLCIHIPHKKDNVAILMRVLMLAAGGLMAVTGSRAIRYEGAGPLGCIILSVVASVGWRKQGYDAKNPVANAYRIIWLVFQPILFGLVGAQVDIAFLEFVTVGKGLIVLFSALLGRYITTVFTTFGLGLNSKEKTFIAWAWFAKATVQAALGPIALEIARRNNSEEEVVYGRKIVVMAVLAILITAPVAAAFITVLGPRLLAKPPPHEPEEVPEKESVIEEPKPTKKDGEKRR